jgi:CO/xanthine dehydrogenase FAD-binding subunit
MIAAAERLEVVRPRKLKEALALLKKSVDDGDPLVPLAGGTDVFVFLNAGVLPDRRYLDLWSLDELRGIRRQGRTLKMGALVTYSDCIASAAVNKLLPILVEAAHQIGGVQIQNRGTLAGNVGNGSPAADAVPVLVAADAQVVLASTAGQRTVPLAEFYTGYRASVRRPDELIVRIDVDVPRGPQVFHKVGTRAAQAISKVVMAAVGHRVALGSVAPTILRLRTLEAYVKGGGRDAGEAKRLVRAQISPIDDVRSTKHYRVRVAESLVEEWINGLPAPRSR